MSTISRIYRLDFKGLKNSSNLALFVSVVFLVLSIVALLKK